MKIELDDVLSRLALPARSNKRGFYETEKLKEAVRILQECESEYRLISSTGHYALFGREPLKNGDEVVLISSHADIVDNIRAPFSEVCEDGYHRGTYDNLGTNGAAVYLMANNRLPENTVVALTSEEESGRCLGAEGVFTYIVKKTGRKPLVIALDVTDEGYDSDRLATIEGYHPFGEECEEALAEAVLSIEGEEQSFEVVKLKKSTNISHFPEAYRGEEETVFDESVFYAKKGTTSFSLCLPGEGSMHSDSGFYVKSPTMRGYALTLEAVAFALVGDREHAAELRSERDACVRGSRDIAFRKRASVWDYSSPAFSWGGEKEEGRDYQMSLFDYDEFKSENGHALQTDPEGYFQGAFVGSYEYDAMMMAVMDEAYEMATYYDERDFDVFYQDMVYTYGFFPSEDIEAELLQIFDDVHAYYDEDYDYE